MKSMPRKLPVERRSSVDRRRGRKQLHHQIRRCRLCGSRLVLLKAVMRWRKVIDSRSGWVRWRTPAGNVAEVLVATQDHIIPRRVARKIGHNSQLLCVMCHKRKSAIDDRQFSQIPERWEYCIECHAMLSRGPATCSVCNVYRGAPIIGWLLRRSLVRKSVLKG